METGEGLGVFAASPVRGEAERESVHQRNPKSEARNARDLSGAV